jgi:Uma2 family endonuclease
MTAARQPRMTLAEFLAWEEQQPERHEFVDGEIFAMSGASLNHNLIIHNLIIALTAQLRGRGCFVFSQGAKVSADDDLVYPDVVVECQQPAETNRVQRPSLVIEVLSPSTAAYDRDKKFSLYQRLASLRTYVLVSQDTAQVDVYRRTEGGWHFSRHTGFDAVLELADPPCRLTLAELYADLPHPLDPPPGK